MATNNTKKPKTYDIEIGKRLSYERLKKGLSQQVFAERIGKSVDMIGRYERGESHMPDDVKDLLHKDFGIDLNYLISGDEDAEALLLEDHIKRVSNERLGKYLKLITAETVRRMNEKKE